LFDFTLEITDAWDGQVGNILQNDILVTSPNMSLLYLPFLDKINVRLKRDNHYGVHDPLYYPQVFSKRTAHIAIILRPNLDPQDPYYPAWMKPSSKEFIPDYQNSELVGLGHLQQDFYLRLRAMCERVCKKITDEIVELNDRFVLEANSQLRTVLARLELPASENDLFMRVAWAQRLALELHARIRWIGKEWSKRLRDAKLRKRVHETVDVVGAFTEDEETLHTLFHAGIPVWWVRGSKMSPNARIDDVVPFLCADVNEKLRLRENTVIDCADRSPPHPIIFTGLCGKPERYIRMGGFLRQQMQYPLLLGSDQPRSQESIGRAVQSAISRSKPSRSKPCG
jgi:hypothetical protein